MKKDFLTNYIITSSRRSDNNLIPFTCSLYDYLITNASNSYSGKIHNNSNDLDIDIYKELLYPESIIYKLHNDIKLKKVFPETSDLLMSIFEVDVLYTERDDSYDIVVRYNIGSDNELYHVMEKVCNYYFSVCKYFNDCRKRYKQIDDIRGRLNSIILSKEYELKQNNRLMEAIDFYKTLSI